MVWHNSVLHIVKGENNKELSAKLFQERRKNKLKLVFIVLFRIKFLRKIIKDPIRKNKA